MPYTAVIPLLFMALKWLAARLNQYGLIPDSIANYLSLSSPSSSCTDKSCCSPVKKSSSVVTASTDVEVIEEEAAYYEFLNRKETMVLKFTATWCMPCKKISPTYQQLAEEYAAHFLEIDVDDLDEIAAEYHVAVMPTFCIVSFDTTNGEKRVETMTGSNEVELQDFIGDRLMKRSASAAHKPVVSD